MSRKTLKRYSPPWVDRIWLWVYDDRIPIYPRLYLLKGDYNLCLCFGVRFRGFEPCRRERRLPVRGLRFRVGFRVEGLGCLCRWAHLDVVSGLP